MPIVGTLDVGLRLAARLPATTIEATDLPKTCSRLLAHHLLDLAGTYGDLNAGDPIQYGELRTE